MTPLHFARFTAFGQLGGSVGPRGVKQAISRRRARWCRGYQGFRNQTDQDRDDLVSSTSSPVSDRASPFEGDDADEHRKPAEIERSSVDSRS